MSNKNTWPLYCLRINPGSKRVDRDPKVTDAIRKNGLSAWDEENWSAVRQYLRAFRSAEELDLMTPMDVRMVFTTNGRIFLKTSGDANTHEPTSSLIGEHSFAAIRLPATEDDFATVRWFTKNTDITPDDLKNAPEQHVRRKDRNGVKVFSKSDAKNRWDYKWGKPEKPD